MGVAPSSTAGLATLLDSAVARRCDAVVVVGAAWDRALAGVARRHRTVRFVVITTTRPDTTSSGDNVSTTRYVPGHDFVPLLDGILPR